MGLGFRGLGSQCLCGLGLIRGLGLGFRGLGFRGFRFSVLVRLGTGLNYLVTGISFQMGSIPIYASKCLEAVRVF